MSEERSPPPFSDAALAEAIIIEDSLQTALLTRTEVSGLAIHGPLSKTCNMAFWLEKNLSGEFTLLISISDVGSFLTEHTTPTLDNEARTRAFTHYETESVLVPLLPGCLAEGSLSLLEGQPCPTLTLSFPVDASFRRGEPSFQLTFVRNRKSFTYQEIDHALADQQAPFSSLLQDAYHLAVILWSDRVLQGALTSYDPETGWVTTEEGDRFLLQEDKRYKCYIIEQELHILSNQAIASYLAVRELPALYRNHQAKATYAATRDGHLGLHLPVYIHATRPLSRYADLLNQRVLLASILGQPSAYTQAELEARAISLNAKETSIKATKPAYFRDQHDEQLQKLIEEEPLSFLSQKQFHSVIRKVAQEHALTPQIAMEILRRLEQQLLKDNDLYTLLFRFPNHGQDWEPIKQAVCHFLLKNPSYAVMVLYQGQQSRKWTVLKCDEVGYLAGPYSAQMVLQYEGQQYTSSLQTASRKDLAKQRACADVLTKIAGMVPPQAKPSP